MEVSFLDTLTPCSYIQLFRRKQTLFMSQAAWTEEAFPASSLAHSPPCKPWVERAHEHASGKGKQYTGGSQDDLKRIRPTICLQRDGSIFPATLHAQVAWLPFFSITSLSWENRQMTQPPPLTPARRKRLLKAYGPCPAGYTHDDLERFLDLLYGMFSDVYTASELRQLVVTDPFDRSEHPRQLKLVELTNWLEALVT